MATENKTEKATPKKKKDERKKGNIFQSKDIVNALSILASFFALKLMMPSCFLKLDNLLTRCIGYINGTSELTDTFAMNILKDSVTVFANIAVPVMLLAIVVSVISAGVQTKFLVSFSSLKPKFSRLSPLSGVKRLFSMRSAVELLKSIIKVIVIALVLWSCVKNITDYFSKLLFVQIIDSILFIFDTIMNMVIQLSIVFIAISALDFLYQWWEYERNMRMTKQEIKEEYKHMEGDPLVKGKIKERQRKMSMQRMMQQVPNADVIIRNPTHYAVALKYNPEKNKAPVLIAKGQDNIALKIIEVASNHDIPTTENRPLARLLYDTVELDMEVPADCYAALAEILAWVYKLKNKESR